MIGLTDRATDGLTDPSSSQSSSLGRTDERTYSAVETRDAFSLNVSSYSGFCLYGLFGFMVNFAWSQTKFVQYVDYFVNSSDVMSLSQVLDNLNTSETSETMEAASLKEPSSSLESARPFPEIFDVNGFSKINLTLKFIE